MKIKVLGSGSISSIYNSASYLIDNNILIDVPNGTNKILKRLKINSKNINNILFTHFHGDHYFDMPFIFLDRLGDKKNYLNIYCDNCGKKKINKVLKLAFPNTVDRVNNKVITTYFSSKKFKINNYDIDKILVDHGNLKPAFGYIFSYDNKKIGFTGDSCLCDAINNMASICDFLICDCCLIEGNHKHMGIDNIMYLSKKYPNCKFYLTHLEDETRKKLLKKKLGRIKILKDYDILVL